HLEARRKREREVLLSELSGDKFGRFLIDLAAFTEGRGWLSASDLDQSAALAAPGADFARAAIHRRWTKTARKGRDVDALTAEQRHELRKSFKTLRYALEFLGPLIARRDLKSLTKRVKAAQEVLGYLNDVRGAQTLVSMVDKAGRKLSRKQAAAVDRAVGFCLGWHEGEAARVWEEAKSTVSLDPKAY
ncbi:MAG TPA: CHAD domain-containing protein, partial [Methylomirabilota bacterium]|nr:CHAD domain-containing protein [Methylomirabilota bacterium]